MYIGRINLAPLRSGSSTPAAPSRSTVATASALSNVRRLLRTATWVTETMFASDGDDEWRSDIILFSFQGEKTSRYRRRPGLLPRFLF